MNETIIRALTCYADICRRRELLARSGTYPEGHREGYWANEAFLAELAAKTISMKQELTP